jgi:hypothetical protein
MSDKLAEGKDIFHGREICCNTEIHNFTGEIEKKLGRSSVDPQLSMLYFTKY